MNRTFVYIVIINVALLAGFILLDFVTWNDVALNLDSRIKTILTPNGIYTNKIIGIYSNYGLIQGGITVRYIIPGIFLPPQDSLGGSINLPFIWFILTMVVNLSLFWYLGIRKLNELTKDSKTEPVSPSERKTN